METPESINLISVNPDVRGGRPCIAGSGLRVTDVVMAHIFHHRSPSEIASDYDISLAEVHAALSYYYQHKEKLDEDIRRQIASGREFKEQGIGSGGESLHPGWNLPVEGAWQLRSRDIAVVTVRDLELLGEEDIDHLRRAAEMGSVLCTYDADFLALAAEGVSHAGIVFGQQNLHYIGTWVNRLELLHAMYTAEDMHNRIEYLWGQRISSESADGRRRAEPESTFTPHR